MSTTLVMDKAGRVVIPKQLRKELHLEPGETLELEAIGDQITLRPVRETGKLIRKQGIWVLQGTGKAITAKTTDALLDQQRLEREGSFLYPTE